DNVELVHHTATKGLTTATAVFKSLTNALGGFVLENEVEVGVNPLYTSPICLDEFKWAAPTASIDTAFLRASNRLDRFGNYWVSSSTTIYVYDPDGNLIHQYSRSDIADMIDGWRESPI